MYPTSRRGKLDYHMSEEDVRKPLLASPGQEESIGNQPDNYGTVQLNDLEESDTKKIELDAKKKRSARYKSTAKALKQAGDVAKDAEKATNTVGEIVEASGNSEAGGIIKHVSKVFCCLSCVAKGSSKVVGRAGDDGASTEDKDKGKEKKKTGTLTKAFKGTGMAATAVKGAAGGVGKIAPMIVDDELADEINSVTSKVEEVAGGASEVCKGAAAVSEALEDHSNKEKSEKKQEDKKKKTGTLTKVLKGTSKAATVTKGAASGLGKIAPMIVDDDVANEINSVTSKVEEVAGGASEVCKGAAAVSEALEDHSNKEKSEKKQEDKKKKTGTLTKVLKGTSKAATVTKGAASGLGKIAPMIVDDDVANEINSVTSKVEEVAGGASEVCKGAAAVSEALEGHSNKEKGEKNKTEEEEENDMEKVGKATEGVGNAITGAGKMAEAVGVDNGFAQHTQDVGGKVKDAGKLTKNFGSLSKRFRK